MAHLLQWTLVLMHMVFRVRWLGGRRVAVAGGGLLLPLVLALPLPAQFGGGPGLGGGGSAPAPPERARQRVPYYGPTNKIPLHEVTVAGNRRVPVERIESMLLTRVGRDYDPEHVERDVRKLMASGLFRNVQVLKRDVGDGKAITFQVEERSTIEYVRFVGNEKLKDKTLQKEAGLSAGDPLNRFAVEEAQRRLEQFYRDKGYVEAHIQLLEGTGQDDPGVVFQIHEGVVKRILGVEFEGNSIASDARLKTQIKSKPGWLWLIGGKVNQDELEQDLDRLTAYYRSLGFFRARVGRQLHQAEDGSWVRLKFVIDEGDRYRIRNISLVGQAKFSQDELLRQVETRPGDFFHLARMQRDLASLRDHYGSQGYIFADIQAEPRFQETPGALDVVFNIDEGQQYRVGQIIVNIDGESTHTRRSVVLNRLSIRPGDVINVRELRASERRLQASQLFLHDPASGITPNIAVKPPQADDARWARPPQGPSTTIRGQSPEAVGTGGASPMVDLVVTVRSAAPRASEELSP